MRRLLLAAALAMGCAHDDAVSFRVFDTRDDPSLETVRIACEIWELECFKAEDEEHGLGSITLILVDNPADRGDHTIQGQTYHHGCTPVVWSIGRVEVVAHELGHAFGLDHVADPMNVMSLNAGGPFTERWQRRIVLRQVEQLALCAEGVKP